MNKQEFIYKFDLVLENLLEKVMTNCKVLLTQVNIEDEMFSDWNYRLPKAFLYVVLQAHLKHLTPCAGDEDVYTLLEQCQEENLKHNYHVTTARELITEAREKING